MSSSISSMILLRQVVQSKELKWAIGGWTFFIAENAILSENRTHLIAALGGDENYHLIYGTLSTAATASIGYAYYHLTRKNPILVQYFKSNVSPKAPLPTANLLISWTCLSVGLVLASQALPKMQIPIRLTSSSSSSSASQQQQASTNSSNDNGVDVIGPLPPPSPQQQHQQGWKLSVQCPFDFSDKYKDNSNNNNNNSNNIMVTGVDRVSRHVGLWSLGFMSAAQAALIIPSTAAASAATTAAASAATSSSSLALFTALWSLRLWWCGPLAVAWLGGMHTDSRFRRGMGGTLDPLLDCQTSNIPFLAMLTGKQGSSAFFNLWSELKPLNAFMATAVATIWIMSKGRRASFVSTTSSSGISSSSSFATAMRQKTTTTTTAASMVNSSKLAAAAAAAAPTLKLSAANNSSSLSTNRRP